LITVAPVRAEAIVGFALIGIFQHFIGFLHVLEVRLAVRLLADIRMVFACELAVGALDVIA